MIRGTTPTFRLTIQPKQGQSVDLSLADNVYVAIKQGNTTIELTGDELEIDENVVSCYLTQEKSLKLVENASAKIQVNWTYTDISNAVKRAATIVKEIRVGEQLIRRVLPDE